MKQKLKNLDVARKKGPDFVRKTIKKLLMESITEPTPFFYDTEFDYEGDEGKKPILFIGEIPTEWKKYVKQNKASKTLAAGQCIFDLDSQQLSLEAKLGKGAKALVLKTIYKEVLKPFAKPQFVDSVENPTVSISDESEETVEEAPLQTSEEGVDVPFDNETFVSEVEDAVKEANTAMAANAPLVDKLSKSLDNLKDNIITMAFIKECRDNFAKLTKLNASIRRIETLAKFGAELNKTQDVNAQIQSLETAKAALGKQQNTIAGFETKINDLNMISEDESSSAGPELVSSDPILEFLGIVNKTFA